MYNDYLEPILQTISYPEVGMVNSLDQILELCVDENRDVHELIQKFKKIVESEDLESMREKYTRTFDLKAMTCLDIGYVLFGEDYKRGAFLVQIQRLQKEYGIDAGSELPDHLPNFLKLLAALPEGSEKQELVEKIFLPALSRIIAEFEREQNQQNYFKYPLKALMLLSQKEFKMNDTVLKGGY